MKKIFFALMIIVFALASFATALENKKISPQEELKYINQLKNKDAVVRRKAIQELDLMNSSKAIPFIIKALNDPDTDVKMLAISTLGTSRDSRAYQPLINLFNDKSKNMALRDRAGLALAFFGNKNAVAHMMKVLETETDKIFQAHIIDNLGYLKDKTIVPKLIPYLKDENWQVRYFTCGTLGSLKNTDAVAPLLEAFKNEINDDVKQQIIYSFGLIGDNRAVSFLIQQLKSKNYQFRRYAVFSLGYMKDPSVIPFIIKALNDKNKIVRGMAAGTLESLKDPISIAPLIKAFNKEKELSVKGSIVRALSAFNDKKAIESLINIAKTQTEDSNIRYTAIESLGVLKTKDALALIHEYAADPTDPILRGVCAWALGEIKDKSSLPVLTKLLKDENESVRKEAKKAIDKINKNT